MLPAGSLLVPLIVGVESFVVPKLLIVSEGASVSIEPDSVSLPILPATSVIDAVTV